MEQRWSPVVEMQEENAECRLRELALKWFTDTQAQLILHDGTVPPWFQGCITRKEAEDMLKDKPLGCFLIRLSDKAIGYILSYRGQDRCRHFVINQNKAGQLVVSGDTETHGSLGDLINFYKTCPIQPFGETLTTSCFQARTPSPSHPPFQNILEAFHNFYQPPLPPKTANRRLTPTTSYNTITPTEAVPTQTRGGAPLRISMSSSLSGQSTLYAQLEHDRGKARTQPPLTGQGSLKITPAFPPKFSGDSGPGSLPWIQPKAVEATPTAGVTAAPGTLYSELNLETCQSQSLPFLDDSQGEQHPYRHAAPSFTPLKLSPNPCKRVTCQTYSLLEHARQPVTLGLSSSSSLDTLSINPLYQTTGGLRPAEDSWWGPHSHAWGTAESRHPPAHQQDNSTYAQVPHEPLPARFLTDNTYELIPDQGFRGSPHAHPSHSNTCKSILDQCLRDRPDTLNSHSNTYELMPDQCLRNGPHGNTYETLKDLQPKHSESGWGIKADTWRRFFPENKKK
ncbi:hypothetical protein AAFF_G00224680 [Aldrovandia affinis]|uniref:SH2 domain-containing protein n=1 Tax=Aldrovandia affinis TaxID=143900 RepID=A0AAD7TB18_9TELE|nr:hypothetical protein AAFF_G00224680 [Aldrovandia affinis]